MARARKAAERKAQLARDKRNRQRREARAKARAKELARLAKLQRAKEARARALKKGRRVNARQKKLRLEREKLRLTKPRTTKERVKEVREEVNVAVAAPPKVTEFTDSFNKLFEIAKKTNQLPHIDYRLRKIDSERAKGRKRMVRIGMLVTEDTVEQIMYAVKKATKQLGGFKIWSASIIMSSMGPEIVGSGGRVLISTHALAFKFQTEAHDSTGVYGSEVGMLARLEQMLEKMADAEHSSLVYLHSVLVQNFTRKS